MDAKVNPSIYAAMGASAILTGYSRMTFSLVVIILETTQNVHLYIPILLTLLSAVVFSNIFSESH